MICSRLLSLLPVELTRGVWGMVSSPLPRTPRAAWTGGLLAGPGTSVATVIRTHPPHTSPEVSRLDQHSNALLGWVALLDA